MEEEEIKQHIARLGYDPRESSDCSIPSNFNLSAKRDLLSWVNTKTGNRLAVNLKDIPHVKEYSVKLGMNKSHEALEEFTRHLTGDARQVMLEYIYAKQYFNVLRQERDLVKWHLANAQKEFKLKSSQVNVLEIKARNQQDKYMALKVRQDRYDKERLQLSAYFKREEDALTERLKDHKQVYEEMQFWLNRRGDYLNETTVERRQATHERKLRTRQYRKLQQAVTQDKKWHVNIAALLNLDNKIYETYQDATNYLKPNFQQIEFITHPIRQKAVQDTLESTPLKDFTSPKYNI